MTAIGASRSPIPELSGAQRTLGVQSAPEKVAAPVWLTRPEMGLCPCGCIGRRRKGSFVSKTIDSTADVARQAIFADEIASKPGLLQRLDPRTKLVGLVALLLVASLVHRVPVLVGLYLGTLVLAWASRVPVWLFVRRVWLFIPIFTAVVVVPATLNVVTPGTIVVPLGTWFGHELGMTRQGLLGAALIVSRVAVSVSLAVLVTFTTSWPQLLGALRSLRVPRMFVVVAAMAHRYIFYLLDAVTDLYLARRARTVKPENLESGRRFVGASAGVLFGKANHLTTEVHQAMVARGYRGDSRTLAPPAFTGVDLAAAGAVIAIAVGLWELGHVLGA